MSVLAPNRREVDIAPNQRFAMLGKTRAGKTVFTMGLAGVLVPWMEPQGWESWWIDTKNDKDDLESLHKWGYREETTSKGGPWWRNWTSSKSDNKGNRKLFKCRDGEGAAWEAAQTVCKRAYQQGGVLLIIDEYTQTTKSQTDPGKDLLNVFTRGGGLDVGIIGLTQEPVYVPRQLLSQATHHFFFNVSFPRDVEYIQKMYDSYEPPMSLYGRDNGKHGFFHVATDYDGLGAYYSNGKEWFNKNIGRDHLA